MTSNLFDKISLFPFSPFDFFQICKIYSTNSKNISHVQKRIFRVLHIQKLWVLYLDRPYYQLLISIASKERREMYGFTKDRGGIMRCGSEIDSGQCNSLNGIPLSSRPTGRDKPRRLLRLFIVRYVVYCVRAEMGGAENAISMDDIRYLMKM